MQLDKIKAEKKAKISKAQRFKTVYLYNNSERVERVTHLHTEDQHSVMVFCNKSNVSLNDNAWEGAFPGIFWLFYRAMGYDCRHHKKFAFQRLQ